MSLILLLAIIFVSLSPSVSAQSIKSTTIYVDGQKVTTTGIVQNGLQLVPASFFRKLNISVSWSTKYKSAVLKNASITIGYPTGQRYTDYNFNGKSEWHRDNLNTLTKNINNTTYVPLAYTARKLGFSIQYDTKLRAAVITTGKGITIQSSQSIKPTAEEIKWLNQITEAEAGGEPYTGKVAVAASILNRVKHSAWPNTIMETIFQVDYYNGKAYYQFSPVLDKRIYSVTPSNDTKSAVQAALNGHDPSLGAIVFYNPNKTNNQWVRNHKTTAKIGNHVFAK